MLVEGGLMAVEIVDVHLVDPRPLFEAAKLREASNCIDPLMLNYSSFLDHVAQSVFRVAMADGVMVGHASLTNLDLLNRKAEFGLMLHSDDLEGRGIGKALHDATLAIAFQRLGLNRVYGRIARFRARAIRLYEKAGWTEEGVDRQAFHFQGEFYDEVRVGMLREEWQRTRG
jgi:RimJ/RimL family protein N-acetyltransferase